MALSILQTAHQYSTAYRDKFSLPIIGDAVCELDDTTSLWQIKISITRFNSIHSDNDACISNLLKNQDAVGDSGSVNTNFVHYTLQSSGTFRS
jgi:hypothetical protein